jgi:hypothetical protein
LRTSGLALAISPSCIPMSPSRIRAHGFREHVNAALELGRHLVQYRLHDRRHARHHDSCAGAPRSSECRSSSPIRAGWRARGSALGPIKARPWRWRRMRRYGELSRGAERSSPRQFFRRHPYLGRTTSSIRADMIFGKDRLISSPMKSPAHRPGCFDRSRCGSDELPRKGPSCWNNTNPPSV